MFAGHIGVALAAGKMERRVNLGVFVLAAVWLDLALWLLVLSGMESVAFPADFSATHQPEFLFPYSHGLLAAGLWSALAGGIAYALGGRLRSRRFGASVLLAAVAFSHWLLDALVHRPELPLADADSARVGLALCRNIPAALAVESALLLAGLWLFVSQSRLSRVKKIALAAVSLFVLVSTIIGSAFAPAPPSAQAMAVSSLILIAVLCPLMGWLGKARVGAV